MHLVQHLNYDQILLFGQAALTMTSVARQIEARKWNTIYIHASKVEQKS